MHETYQGFRITYELDGCSGTALVGGMNAEEAKGVLKAELLRQYGDDSRTLDFRVQTCVADPKIQMLQKGVTMNSLDDF